MSFSWDLYREGARVWLPDSTEVWVPGQVVSLTLPGGKGAGSGQAEIVVSAEEGPSKTTPTTITVVSPTTDLPPLRNPELLLGASDLTTLSYLHEPAVLHNLRLRFESCQSIYTYCGIVLVAINPYCSLPIYGKEFASAYSHCQLGELDPHIYAVAEDAYRAMTREGRSQSVVVSGESGAGKTVSAKYALRYFAAMGVASVEDDREEDTSSREQWGVAIGGVVGGGMSSVERKVLACNPIMEAIGNAKTVRNDNSSRFGKYLDIQFNQSYEMVGAHMRTYLLERTRCVRQAQGERNYHIFYQLCAAASAKELYLDLGPASSYHYTNQGRDLLIVGVDDLAEFRTMRASFHLLGIQESLIQQFFEVLAAILALGNTHVGVAHCGGEEVGSVDISDPWLERTATLLQVDVAGLQKWLTHRLISTGRETITKPLTHPQTVTARDGLAKHLYVHLFEWVVVQLNHALGSTQQCHAHIGVLDIYGFEVFEENSFEQFCINYANEKLQQQFNHHVFKLEQQEYIKEAIEWSFIDFHDNQLCIDLIEGKLGICDLLDETCKLPKGDDAVLLRKLCEVHLKKGRGSGHFATPLRPPGCFSVRHYAGVVTYDTLGFVEKNRDAIMPEHLAVLKTSKLPIVLEFFQSGTDAVAKATTSRSRSVIGPVSVGSQFRSSLSELMSCLNTTSPHYIRCIKPNDYKKPFTYCPQRVVQQLRACGVLETVRISAAGFPSRWTYQDFLQRYHALLPPGHAKKGGKREESAMTVAILKATIKSSEMYRLGHTKVFFRAGQVAYLEHLRHSRLRACGLLLQRNMRAWLARKRYLRLRKTVIRLQTLARGYLARNLAAHLRQEQAAVLIQRRVRGWQARRRYLAVRKAALSLQCLARGVAARRAYRHLLLSNKARCIQRHVRGWLARRAYQRSLRGVVLVQCCVRKWLAKRLFKKLKAEARSVANLQKLNKGMENKIIQLQQKLTEQRMQCQQWEKAWQEAHTSLEATQQQVAQTSSALEVERSRSTTQEEELNKALSEKTKLQGELEELRAELLVIRGKLATLEEERKQEQEVVKEEGLKEEVKGDEAWHKDEMKAWHEEEPVMSGSLLSPTKNYWKASTSNGRSPSERSPTEKKRRFSEMSEKIETPMKKRRSLFPDWRSPTSGHVSPRSWSVSSRLPSHEVVRQRKDLDSGSPKLKEGRGNGDAHTSIPIPELRVDSKSAPELGHARNFDTVSATSVQKSEQNAQSESSSVPESKGVDSRTAASTSLILEPACAKDLDSILLEIENVGVATTPQWRAIQNTHMEADSLERRGHGMGANDPSPLLQRSLSGLYRAYDLINTLTSMNVTMQEKMDSLTRENTVLRERSMKNLTPPPEVPQGSLAPPRVGVALTPLSPDLPDKHSILTAGSVATPPPPFSWPEEGEPLLGMLSWQHEDLQRLLNQLIANLRPEGVAREIPCLPAHILFMCLRYADYCRNKLQAVRLLEGVVSSLQTTRGKSHEGMDHMVFWLVNTVQLKAHLHQYSAQQNLKGALMNFDLSQYEQVLSQQATLFYHKLVDMIHKKFKPMIVPGLVEHEAIPGLTTSRPITRVSRSLASHTHNITLQNVLNQLSGLADCLERYCPFTSLTQQILRQTFYLVNAVMLNAMLLRRELCHWAKGVQIRYNISQLEDWCRSRGVAAEGVASQLAPVVQASKLLQMRKSSEADVDVIGSLCTQLNALQVQKLLTMYTPSDQFEERVPAIVIQQVAKRGGASGVDPNLIMIDSTRCYPVELDGILSDVIFSEISLPNKLGLTFLKKI